LAGIKATEGVVHMSWATDKANVGGLGLMNTVYALPTNVAFVAAPVALI
jgi:hypothetical protein